MNACALETPPIAGTGGNRRKQVVVIGSGFGGLAAAVRLQTQGYAVTLVEAREQLGGRAQVFRQGGFTFDGGPTVITAPFLLEELFAGAGRRIEDYVKIVPVDPFYRIAFHDGRCFDYSRDGAAMERQIAAFAPGDLPGYHAMLSKTRAIFDKGFTELADKPFLKFSDMLRIAPDLIRLQSHKTVYQFVSGYIRDPFLRRVFSFHPLLVGGNPFQTTSIYALIQHLERQWGVHYAIGGTGAVIAAMGRLFTELGGRTMLNTPARRIVVENGAAVGVETDAGTLRAEAVVSNADAPNTYRKLIRPVDRRKNTDARLERMRYSMGLFVFYFGTNRQYPDVKHHTILLGERYESLLDDIFNKHRLTEDFSVYLHRPTATDPAMAPAGCDSFYALVPVPNLRSGADWRIEGPRLRERLIDYLETHGLPDLRQHLATDLVLTPLDFEQTLNSYLGAGFSLEPIFSQSAWFRPHNESEDVRNLFLVGAGTHPGAGIPGVLSSAKIAEKLVRERVPC